jgi:hypothetical protein
MLLQAMSKARRANKSMEFLSRFEFISVNFIFSDDTFKYNTNVSLLNRTAEWVRASYRLG